MKRSLLTILPLLLITGAAEGHASHSHAAAHAGEHLLFYGVMAVPRLLLLKPVLRSLAKIRK